MKTFVLLGLLIFSTAVSAQNFNETHKKIRASVENREYQTAVNELQNLLQIDKKHFEINNYDYLLARLS